MLVDVVRIHSFIQQGIDGIKMYPPNLLKKSKNLSGLWTTFKTEYSTDAFSMHCAWSWGQTTHMLLNVPYRYPLAVTMKSDYQGVWIQEETHSPSFNIFFRYIHHSTSWIWNCKGNSMFLNICSIYLRSKSNEALVHMNQKASIQPTFASQCHKNHEASGNDCHLPSWLKLGTMKIMIAFFTKAGVTVR